MMTQHANCERTIYENVATPTLTGSQHIRSGNNYVSLLITNCTNIHDKLFNDSKPSSLIERSLDRVYGIAFARAHNSFVRVQAFTSAKRPNAVLQRRICNHWNIGDSIVEKLSCLKVGWSGSEHDVPSQFVVRDIKSSLLSLDFSREPDIEVDVDGSVVLLWEETKQCFALTFRGNGMVVGTLSPQTSEYVAWAVPVWDAERLRSTILPQAMSSVVL